MTLYVSRNNIKLIIRSFGDKDTAAVFAGYFVKRLPAAIQQRAREKLRLLNAATDVNTLRVPPGNKLEQLAGNRLGQWSIRINNQWRVCFSWREGDAYDVEIVDYH